MKSYNKSYTLSLVKFIFLFLIGYTNSNAQIVPFSFIESFENDNPVTYWTSSSDLPKPIITYKFDNKTATDGNRSLFIDANITGLPNNEKWYYYLEISLKEKVNLEGNLSFSIDVKMDKLSAKHIAIGLNLPYYPASSGLYIFDKINDINQWSRIKGSNLKLLTLSDTKSWIDKNIYNGSLDDIGRGIDRIGILMRGRGSKHLKFHLDNIKIVGTQTKHKEFISNYITHWEKYLLKIKRDILEVKKIRNKFPYLSKLSKLDLSSIEKERYILGEKYLLQIDDILKNIEHKNKNKLYFKPKIIKELNHTMLLYKKIINSLNSKDDITLYKFPAFKYYRLTGDNRPLLKEVQSYKLRMTEGEYKSIALLMQTNHNPNIYTATTTSFCGKNGCFSEDNLDLYIAKIWYQAGLDNTHKSGKFLTQELLLKDESLVRVDFKKKTNYLKVVNNSSGKTQYIDISNPEKLFPQTDLITFNDSKRLKPFKLDSIKDKLLWGIVHVPKKTSSGVYKSTIKFKDSLGKIQKKVVIEVEVLPFSLDKSKLIYSLYYHGKLDDNAQPINAFQKTAKQLILELIDMKKHGVLYPTSYDDEINKLDRVLSIRDKIGFPKDKFYSLGIITSQSNLPQRIKAYKERLDVHGYGKDSLYIYSRDEAKEDKLKEEIKKIKIAKNAGAKVFVAGYDYTYKYIGDVLDMLVYSKGAIAKNTQIQVDNWHKSKHNIFAYASPQVGVENPEIYRRNFGCKLWKKGFDGAMNYAYQKQYGSFWNDFDNNPKAPKYREETFTYPTTNGLIGTIQWEGYREAITDVRYISTLENLRDKLKAKGNDTSKLDNWINNIDCSLNLNQLREDIIDKILSINDIM